ncbi:MAG: RrF2 family transcriptional regulator [Massiliimalia sp.]|jgi:Rrf2 family protein
MKISTKGRYAVRMMLDLALHGEDGYIPLKSVAAHQQISNKYLEQIVIQLNRAGYVKSIRGVQGGYALTKSPKEYTVGDILRAVEGDLAPVACLDCKVPQPCSKMDSCATVVVWRKLKQAIDQVVDSYTLQDLINIQNERSAENDS